MQPPFSFASYRFIPPPHFITAPLVYCCPKVYHSPWFIAAQGLLQLTWFIAAPRFIAAPLVYCGLLVYCSSLVCYSSRFIAATRSLQTLVYCNSGHCSFRFIVANRFIIAFWCISTPRFIAAPVFYILFLQPPDLSQPHRFITTSRFMAAPNWFIAATSG